eukprot:3473275-Rhodomonas_salina.4
MPSSLTTRQGLSNKFDGPPSFRKATSRCGGRARQRREEEKRGRGGRWEEQTTPEDEDGRGRPWNGYDEEKRTKRKVWKGNSKGGWEGGTGVV